jgi:putative aldouronate transport system permease protein
MKRVKLNSNGKDPNKISWAKDIAKHKTYFLMLLPAIIFFLLFSYLPMFGIYMAFIDYDFKGGVFGSDFIGWKNFEFLFRGGFQSQIFRLIKNTVTYNVAFILIGNMMQIFVAILLKDIVNKRFVRIAQTLMFMPYFVSMVIVGTVAYNTLNTDYGLINSVMGSLGFKNINFYTSPKYWPFILVFVNVWKGIGYGVVVYLAALLGIDDSIYEAAYVDGASIWKRIRFITLPLLKPTFVTMLLLATGGILRGQFDLFYQLIGKNGILYNATDIIDTYVYRALAVSPDYGMGSAAGLVQSGFGLVLILLVNRITRKLDPDSALF